MKIRISDSKHDSIKLITLFKFIFLYSQGSNNIQKEFGNY